MALESKPGKNAKVSLGEDNKVQGMGTWSFDGNYKKDDTQGQDYLNSAQKYTQDITNIRFYVDSVSYYTPNSTTAAGGGLLADSPISYVNITGSTINTSTGALAKGTFTGKISGVMRLI